ncbi:MAG: C25 family cysteine peptidase [Candidatus Kapaibacterium sp.]
MKYIIAVLALLIAGTDLDARVSLEPGPTGIKIGADDFTYSVIDGIPKPESDYADNLADSSSAGSMLFVIGAPRDTLNYDITIRGISELITEAKLPYKSDIVSSKYMGTARGVHIHHVRVTPFYIDPLTGRAGFVNAFELNIHFGQEVEFAGKGLKPFRMADNPYQAAAIEDNSRKKVKKSERLLNESIWYSPERDYIEIQTVKDGIASIAADDLISLMPELSGKSHSGIHLLYRGKAYPYYIKSNDDVLNSGDTLYFKGSRPLGDTTYLDHYAEYEAFYLYFDNNSLAYTYSHIDESEYDSELTQAYIRDHIHQDRYYDSGPELENSHTAVHEGWYHAVLYYQDNGYYRDRLDIDFDIYPSDSEVKAKLHYNHFIHYTAIIPGVKLKAYINQIPVLDTTITGSLDDSLTFKFDNSMLFRGKNRFSLEISQLPDDGLNGLFAVESFIVESESVPYAFNGLLDYSTDIEGSTINRIDGLPDKSIIAIDQKNNNIYFPGSFNSIKSGANINAGAFSYYYGDHSQFSGDNNIHIALPEDTSGYRNYGTASDAIKYLDSIAAGQLVFIAYNGSQPMPSTLINKLKNSGSLLAGSADSNLYLGLFKKENGLIDEKTGNGSLSLNHEINSGNFYRAEFITIGNSPEILISSSKNLIKPNLKMVSKSDLRSETDQADAIYIVYPDFMEAAEKLAAHRESHSGVSVKIINADDIYKEFGYGIKTPHAIKDYLKFAYSSLDKPAPEYLLIVGDASIDSRRQRPFSVAYNFVPTYGVPASDYWYGLLDGDDDIMPEMSVGRIPAVNINEVYAYVDKVIEYDKLPAAPWMKKILFLSGGLNDVEVIDFYNKRYLYSESIIKPEFCGDTISIRKGTGSDISEKEAGQIRKSINDGVLWTLYLGHASSGIFDMDGWQVHTLNNGPRFSILSTLSCNTGAFAQPDFVHSRNEDNILEPGKGFVASMGATSTGYVDAHTFLLRDMFIAMTRKNLAMRRLGDMLNYGKSKLSNHWKGVATKYNYSLLGDPMLEIKPTTEPDPYLLKNYTKISDQDGTTHFDENDEHITIEGSIFNNGYCHEDSLTLVLSHEFEGSVDKYYIGYTSLCYKSDFSFEIDIREKTGRHSFTLHIDPDSSGIDVNRMNNILNLNVEVFRRGLAALDPQPFWDVDPVEPRFRFINPAGDNADFDYEFMIVSDTVEKNSDQSEVTIEDNYVDWKPGYLEIEGNALLKARIIEQSSGYKSAWLEVPFHLKPLSGLSKANYNISEEFLSHLSTEDMSFTGKYLNIDRNDLDFQVLSVGGRQGLAPYSIIEVGESVYISQSLTGFSLAAIPVYNNGKKPRFRLYDTFNPVQDTIIIHDEDEPGPDTLALYNSTKIVRFLRDSVSEDEYVFISLGGACMNLFHHVSVHDSTDDGTLDSLKRVMKMYGAQLSDSLRGFHVTGNVVSYAYAGRKGASHEEIFEGVNMFSDSVLLKGQITKYEKEGNFTSSRIGPAKKWEKISFLPDRDGFGKDSEIILTAINRNGLEDTLVYTGGEMDISHLDASEYPYLTYKGRIKKDELKINPGINGIEIDYEPAPELAVIKDDFSMDKDKYLRSEYAEYTYGLANLSLRSEAESVFAKISVIFDTGQEESFNIEFPEIAPDSRVSGKYTLNTSNFDNYNIVRFDVEPDNNGNEEYRFNNVNEIELNVYEDTEKPRVRLFVDDKEPREGDYISRHPVIRAELYDNTPQVIDDSNNLRISINLRIQRPDSTDLFDFQSHRDKGDHKATLTIIPKTDFYQNIDNLIRVEGIDPAGNRETLKVLMRKPKEGNISISRQYPNPFSTKIDIDFDVITPQEVGTAEFRVYDFTGQLVAALKQEAEFGENTITWNGADSNGAPLPPGAYYYVITVDGGYYDNPARGRIMLIR